MLETLEEADLQLFVGLADCLPIRLLLPVIAVSAKESTLCLVKDKDWSACTYPDPVKSVLRLSWSRSTVVKSDLRGQHDHQWVITGTHASFRKVHIRTEPCDSILWPNSRADRFSAIHLAVKKTEVPYSNRLKCAGPIEASNRLIRGDWKRRTWGPNRRNGIDRQIWASEIFQDKFYAGIIKPSVLSFENGCPDVWGQTAVWRIHWLC